QRRKQTLRLPPGKRYRQSPLSSRHPFGDKSWKDFGLREWARVISRWTLGTNAKEVGVLEWWSTGKGQSSFLSRFVASNPHSSQYADPPNTPLLQHSIPSFNPSAPGR